MLARRTPAPARILLVEDDPGDALLARETIRELFPGTVVAHTPSGAQAIAMVSNPSAPCDLALLDLNLPGVSGLDVLRARRASARALGVPFVVFTTSSSPRDIATAYRLGANAVLTKPADLDEYTAALRATMTFWLQFAERAEVLE